MSSESQFAYSQKYNTFFIVQNTSGSSNTSPDKKTIKIFNYPILWGDTRDILAIPGVQEADIRASLLKGELRHKFLCGDIVLVESTIDLLQFDDNQRGFLAQFGFDEGVSVNWDELDGYVQELIQVGGSGGVTYVWREKISLIGMRDGTNRTFYTPDKFLNGSFSNNIFHITVEHNGKELYENVDFTIAESNGPGTGYDTINIFSFTPVQQSILYVTYAIKA